MILKREIFKNYSKSVPSLDGTVILSAVRTPIGLINGVLKEFSAPHLGSFAIKEALQRAVVPTYELENIFLGCVSHKNCHEEVLKRTMLSKNTKISVSTCGMQSLLKAAEFLQLNNNKAVVVAGMESFTNLSRVDSQLFETYIKSHLENWEKIKKNSLINVNKYVDENYTHFQQAAKSRAYADKVFKIDFRKKGEHIVVTEDEIAKKLEESLMPGDEALALVISTKDYYKNNGLVPLAEIISFNEELSNSDLSSVIKKVLKNARCEQKDIARWEIHSVNDILDFMSYFDIDSSRINKYGNIFGIEYPFGTFGLRSVCHFTHFLSTGELGCVAGFYQNGIASAVIIRKLGGHKSAKPKLTLYTKSLCPLCDELKQQLKPFEGQISLSEVDIEAKGNEKFKELYQYEIPVLFFNGIFFCKHVLNIQDFEHRLSVCENDVE